MCGGGGGGGGRDILGETEAHVCKWLCVCGPWSPGICMSWSWCDVLQFIVHIVQLFILPTGAVDTSTDYRDLASCSSLLHNDNSILRPH